MAPQATWTHDRVQKLFALLREHHSELFIKSSTSNNIQRKLNTKTFETIANELNMPVQVLKYKYFNLNCAYNAELKKIDSAKKQGFFYRPTLPWYNEFHDIMKKIKGRSVENEQEEFKSQRVSSQEDSISEEVELEEAEDPLEETSNADSIVVTIKQEYIDGPLKGSRDVDFEEDLDSVEFVEETLPVKPIQQVSPAVRKPDKRKLDKKQDVETFLATPVEASEEMDEFQMFANHVAEQLRHMNANSARKMQSEIHIIFDEEGFPFDSPVLEDMT